MKNVQIKYKIQFSLLPLLLFVDASVVFRQIVSRCECLQIFLANQDLQLASAFNVRYINSVDGYQ